MKAASIPLGKACTDCGDIITEANFGRLCGVCGEPICDSCEGTECEYCRPHLFER